MADGLSGLVIRPFRPQDQQAARGLVLAGMEEHWGYVDPTRNPDLDDIAAAHADGTFLVAWRSREPVGTGALIREAEGVARVVRMTVARRVRRQGIGSLILQQLLRQARREGYSRVVLETTSTWGDAIAFYRRHGFTVVGMRDGDAHFVLELRPGEGNS